MAHILIVDDDPDILRLMQFSIQKAGYSISLATDGEQALVEVRRKHPDLIIVDIMMPHMTGYQFTKTIRAMPGMKNLPILIYSARFQPVDKKTALDAGATDYLSKTVSPDKIVDKIKDLLGSQSEQKTGRNIAFFSLRGGVGVSTLTSNVATIVSLSKKQATNLVDLNPVGGHIGMMMGLRTKRGIATLMQDSKELTRDTVEKHSALHEASNINVFCSPMQLNQKEVFHTSGDILSTLSQNSAFIFWDLPSVFTPEVSEILPKLYRLVLVLSPDLPAIQSTVVALQNLPKLGVAIENIKIVLNNNTETSPIKIPSIEKALKMQLFADIPYDVDAAAAIRTGKPFIIYKAKSVTTTALAQLSAKLIQ